MIQSSVTKLREPMNDSWPARGNRIVVFILLALSVFLLLGCGYKRETLKADRPGKKGYRIAVLAFENLSGTSAPIKEIRAALINRMRDQGFDVLDEETLQKIMARHRIRYVGGLDQRAAQAFKAEADVDGVLLTSIEMYIELVPPKIGLTSRLVSTGEKTTILWMDGVGMAGDNSPGVLGLGLIEDYRVLVNKALQSLSDSLAGYVWNGRTPVPGKRGEKRFEPKVAYRSPEIDPGGKYTVAVIPFFNMTNRRNAGEIVVLQFMRELAKLDQYNVLELGEVRQRLLNARVILEGGIALADVDFVANSLEADFVLTGKVMEYQDYEGSGGAPKIDFFMQMLERKRRRIVWSSHSHNSGDDGVFFFDRGRINTTHVMMGRMVRAIGKAILEARVESAPPPVEEPPVQPNLGGV
jgi:TolB-like protein